MVPRGKIQTGEDGGALELVKSIIYARHRVLVLDSEFVEGTIVDDHA
jgi:hypothetical protein